MIHSPGGGKPGNDLVDRESATIRGQQYYPVPQYDSWVPIVLRTGVIQS